jgi:hypothetical protein
MTLIGAAQERGKRFETELKDADDASRTQLLARWKELILEEIVKLFAITDDTQILLCLDSNIALGQEITRGKKNDVSDTQEPAALAARWKSDSRDARRL